MNIFQNRSPKTFFWTARGTSDDPRRKFPSQSGTPQKLFQKTFLQNVSVDAKNAD